MVYTVCINGSRDFTDYEFLKEQLDKILNSLGIEFFQIISGGARGADTLAERYARENGIQLKVMKAEWGKHGKAAGFLRNKAMIDISDFLISFWDGSSKGTKHTIDYARSKNLGIHVVYYLGVTV